MKKQVLIFILPILFLVTSCQSEKQVVVQSTPHLDNAQPRPAPAPGGAKSPGSQNSGTVDGGGGNGIQGKPLERFKFNIEDLPEFKTLIAPVLEKIEALSYDFYGRLSVSIRQKSWYLVPVELNEIPQHRLGVAFKTEQLALQTKYEVWLSNLKFEKMTSRDKALLIVHEIIMSAIIAEFLNSHEDQWKPDLELEIDKHQHEAVRHLNNMLFDSKLDLTPISFIEQLKKMGFGTFFPSTAKYQQLINKKIGAEELFKMWEAQEQAGTLPVNLGSKESPEQCRIQIFLKEGEFQMKLDQTKPLLIPAEFGFKTEQVLAFDYRLGHYLEVRFDMPKGNDLVLKSRVRMFLRPGEWYRVEIKRHLLAAKTTILDREIPWDGLDTWGRGKLVSPILCQSENLAQ